MPRRARRGEIRALRERFPARPLGGPGAEAHHPRAGRAGTGAAQIPAGPAAAPGGLMSFPGRHLVLSVSGGVACYKSCTLAPRLTEDGAVGDGVLTAAAAEVVRPLPFQALT